MEPTVFDAYNLELHAKMKLCIWHVAGQASYYVNRHGRSGVNIPWLPEKC